MRVLAYRLVTHKYFERFILLLIALSSIKLIIDTYLRNIRDDDSLMQISNYLDMIFTIAFAIEAFVKTIALGFA